MKSRALLALLCAAGVAILGGGPVRADDDPLSYSDPAMHFDAPAGWVRYPLQAPDPSQGSNSAAPVAAWAFDLGKPDQRHILITVEPWDGALEDFARSHESDLRKQSDGTFIDKHEKATLSNGMPAIRSASVRGTRPVITSGATNTS